MWDSNTSVRCDGTVDSWHFQLVTCVPSMMAIGCTQLSSERLLELQNQNTGRKQEENSCIQNEIVLGQACVRTKISDILSGLTAVALFIFCLPAYQAVFVCLIFICAWSYWLIRCVELNGLKRVSWCMALPVVNVAHSGQVCQICHITYLTNWSPVISHPMFILAEVHHSIAIYHSPAILLLSV